MIKKTFILTFFFVFFAFIFSSSVHAEETDITNKTQIEIEFAAERFSDNQIYLKNPSLQTKDLGVVEAESNARFKINPNLGTKTDERDNCVVLRGDRRTGICEDGIYVFKTQSFDAAGNGNTESSYSIERDTVKPATPNVDLSTIGYNVYARVKGETKAEVLLNGQSSNFYNLIDGESYQLVQNGYCETTYSFTFQLKDRAGNISDSVNKSITTGACPRILGAEDQTNYKDRVLELLGILEGSWGNKFSPMDDWRGELHMWNDSCKVWVKDYKYIQAGGIDARMDWSGGHSAAVVFYNPNFDRLFVVSNAIWVEYYEEGGPCGVLGLPRLTDGQHTERPAGITWESRNNGVTSAAYQRFEGGTIYWHWNNNQGASRAHATYGKISNMYESAGGTWSRYGFPISDVYMSGPTFELCQDFEFDKICIEQDSGSGDGEIFDFDLIGLQEIEIEPEYPNIADFEKFLKIIMDDVIDLANPVPISFGDYYIWEFEEFVQDLYDELEESAYFLFGILEGAFNSIKDTVEFIIDAIFNGALGDLFESLKQVVESLIQDPAKIMYMFYDMISEYVNMPKRDRFRMMGNILGEFVPDAIAGVLTGGAALTVVAAKSVITKIDDVSRVAAKLIRFADKVQDISYGGVVIKGLKFTNRGTSRLTDLALALKGKSLSEINAVAKKMGLTDKSRLYMLIKNNVDSPNDLIDFAKYNKKGSTGRTKAENLMERLVMDEVVKNGDKIGKVIIDNSTQQPLILNDPRWPSNEGWIKMRINVKSANGKNAEIHWVKNKLTSKIDDFKFKD